MTSFARILRLVPDRGAYNRKVMRRIVRPSLELIMLEDRLTPAVVYWDGGSGGNSNWTTPENWVGDVAPVATDSLVFPTGASRLTNTNDFAAGTVFESLTIEDAGYAISGNSVDLTTGIAATFTAGNSELDLDAVLGDGSIAAATGGTLTLGGALGGSAGLTVTGGGTVSLEGVAANTYTGVATVTEGTLLLNKTGGVAVTGDLVVGDGSGTDVVQLLQADQIADTGNVAVDAGFLDLNEFSDVVAGLTLTGGSVATGAGTLTLGGNVVTNAAASTSSISGNLDLGGSATTFDVAEGTAPGGIDLDISAVITNGSLVKSGAGRLALGGDNTFTGDVTATAGYLRATHSNAFGDPSAAATIAVQNGASVELANDITVPATKSIALAGVPVVNASKLINVSGANVVAGDISLSANNQSIDVNSGSTLTLTGGIAGSVDWDKNGPGTLVYAGTSTHTGNVNVGNGILRVDGSLASSSLVFVDGVLTGAGDLPAVSISAIGTFAPGTGPGVVPAAALTLTSGATFAVELNGPVAGTGYDQVMVAGAVDLTGATLTISLGYSPATGTVFTLIDNTGGSPVTGTFNGLPEGATVTIGNQSFTISYVGGTGDDVTLTALLRVSTWTGAGGDTNWTTAANWASGVAPVAGDQLVFASGAAQTTSVNDFAASTVFDSIVIQGAGYTFSGNPIQLDNGVTTTYSSGASTLNVDVTLTADQAIDVATGGTLAIGGTVSGGYAITKSGGGDLNMSALSSFSGGTTVAAGTLNLTSSTALLGSGGVTVAAGASLGFDGSAGLPNALTIGGTGVGGTGALKTYGNSSADIITGSITLTADLLVNVASQSQFAFNGVISGSFGITTTGGGTINMAGSGSNTFTGTFTQNNAFVVVAKTGGAIAIPHDLVVQSGTFLTQRDEQIADSATLTVYEGAEFDLVNANETIGGIVFNGGLVASNSNTLTVTGDITVNTAATTAGIFGRLDLGGATRTIAVADGAAATDLTISAEIVNGGITKTGAGTLLLTNANTYTGGTTVSAGIVAISDGQAFGTGDVTNNGEIDIANNLLVANNFTVGSAGTAFVVTGLTTITGTVTLTADVVIDTPGFANLYLSGVVSGTGFELVKNGTGTLGLNGVNTYTGGTTVNAGSLQVFDGQATGTTGTVVLGGGATLVQSTSIYTLPAGGLTLAAGSTFLVPVPGDATLDGTVTLTGDAGFSVASGASLTIPGAIGGSFGLTKTGAGLLLLDGTSGYTGATTVAAGTLQIDGDISASSGAAVALGSILSGSGIVDGVTSTGGVLAPTLLQTGAVTLDGSSVFQITLAGTTPGTGYSQLSASGVIDLGGATLDETLGAYVPTPGDTLRIVDNTGASAVVNTFGGLAEGSMVTVSGYTFTISYVGGDGNDVTLTNVAVTTATLIAGSAATVVGESVTFTLVVAASNGTATGSVTFKDNGIALPAGTVTLATVLGQQVATYTTGALAVGSHLITADYAGTTYYLPTTASLASNPLVVSQASTTVAVTSTGSSVVGESVTFTATVSVVAPGAGTSTGTIQFVVDGSNFGAPVPLDGSGQATLMSAAFAVGPHTVTAEYSGSTDFLANTGTLAGGQTVNQASSAVAVTSSGATVFGQSVTFTATVAAVAPGAGTPTGTVAFFDGATLLGIGTVAGGVATLATAGLSVGSHTVTAVYSGDADFTGATDTLAGGQVVDQASSSVSLASSVTPSVLGTSVTFTATVAAVAPGAGTPTGTVAFFDGATLLGTGTVAGGVATLATAGLTVGSHTVTAVYSGDADFTGSTSAPVTQLVARAASTTVVGTSDASTTFGEAVTFTATVTTPVGTPTGTVTFFDGATAIGSATVAGGVATLSGVNLGAGTYAVTAVYSGDGNFTPSTSAPVAQVVAPAGTTTGLTASAAAAMVGQSVTFTAVVTTPAAGAGTPTGSVTFRVGNQVLATVPLQAGTAVFATAALPAGELDVTATFNPGANFAGSTAAVAVDVANQNLVGVPAAVLGSTNGSVQLLNADGSVSGTLTPFPGYTGEVRTAQSADGTVVAATGPGVTNRLVVVDPVTQTVRLDVNPFEVAFTGGLYVSTGDVLGTGTPQVIVSPDEGGGPRVQIRDANTGEVLRDFFGIDDPNFRGGVRTSVADVTGDGVPDLIVAAGFGGGPRVTIYDGAALRDGKLTVVANFFVFEQSLRNGVFVTAGDLNGDGKADLIVGGGPGGGPRVFALSGADITAGNPQPAVLANFFAGDPANRGGVRIAVKDLDGDDRADLVTSPGPGGGSVVTAYAGKAITPTGTPPVLFSYDDPSIILNGAFVG